MDRNTGLVDQFVLQEKPHSQNQEMTDDQLEQAFRQWWAGSYPTPPGTHALATHLGWGRWLLLQQAQQQQQREVVR